MMAGRKGQGYPNKKFVIPKDRNINEHKKVTCAICDRPNGTIRCRHCQYELKGRIKMDCPTHPKVLFFTDQEKCPKCKVGLFEDVTKMDIYSPTKKEATVPDKNCICLRRVGVVYCLHCTWYAKLRKRLSCPVHPKKFFLYDCPMCPECKSTALEENLEI